MEKIDIQIDELSSIKKISRKTMKSYKQTLRLFARYLEDNVKITDATKLTDKMFRVYIVSIQERGKYTITSDNESKKQIILKIEEI